MTFAGTAQGIEARVVPREGFALDVIRSSGVKGKSLFARARGAALVPVSLADGWRIVSARRPSLVIGVGGYSSGPVVLVAALRRVPTMLLEQNAVPGLTNRLLSRVVDAAAVTFDSTQAFFGVKAFVSGNPVRPEFFAASGSHQESALDDQTSVTRVLVFAALRAHAINVAMVEASQLAAVRIFVSSTRRGTMRWWHRLPCGFRPTSSRSFDMDGNSTSGRNRLPRRATTLVAEITAAEGRGADSMPTATDQQRKNAEALAVTGGELLLRG